MTTDGFAMFVHITAVIVGLMLAAVLHTGLLMTRRARTVAESRPWAPVIGRVEPLLPLAALIVLASGAWLLHLSGGEARWSDGWVVVSLITLAVIETCGGLVAPRSKAWRTKLTQAPEGPVPDDIRRAGLDPALWYVGHGATAGFIGIVLVMSAKPSTAWSVAIVIAAIVVGLATAVPFLRHGNEVRIPDQRTEPETPADALPRRRS